MKNTQLKDRLIALGLKTTDDPPATPTPLRPAGVPRAARPTPYQRAVTMAVTGVGTLTVELISLRGGEQWLVRTPETQTVINDRAEATQVFNDASRVLLNTLPLHPTKVTE